jgi:tetratricopeptide (TPR) repeat protein
MESGRTGGFPARFSAAGSQAFPLALGTVLRCPREHLDDVVVQAIEKLALETPFELGMIQIAGMQIEVIRVHGYRRIPELDDHFHALSLSASREIKQGVLIQPQLGENAVQSWVGSIGHSTILSESTGPRRAVGVLFPTTSRSDRREREILQLANHTSAASSKRSFLSSLGYSNQHKSCQEVCCMRKFQVATLILLTGLSIAISRSHAQSAVLTLPVASQRATVSQRVGITDITVTYHRPLVNGRKIWGNIVPYGEVWRAGANENTTVEFADPVSVEGRPLAKGVYGLHMIPGENEWILILSKTSTAWGSFTYREADDALRVAVKPHPSEPHEALTYDFDDVKPDATVLTLRWEKLAVPLKINVDVHGIVKQSLHNQLQGLAQYTWEGWDDAATYLADNKYDLEEALQYEDTSIKTEERFDNLITKSRILDQLNRKDEATATRKRAIELASAPQLYFYGRQLQGQGKQDQAFEYYRQAAEKNPNDWVAHMGTARIYSAQGDFDRAEKEMQLSLAGAPDNQKIFLAPMVKKLEAKQDINK